MKKEVLVVLGSPNSPTGVLSDISKSRLNYCLKCYSKEKLILCTGGWGEHFNTAKKSHATYAQEYLIQNSVQEKAFIEIALSSNTVDDAVKIKAITQKMDNIHLTIITSDYHLDRVKLIFEDLLKSFELDFIGVKSCLKKETYNALVNHEKKEILSILEKGLYY